MQQLIPFRTYRDPIQAEELLEVLQKLNIPYESSFERIDDSEEYIGSNPFDTNIVFKINNEDFPRVEALIKGKFN